MIRGYSEGSRARSAIEKWEAAISTSLNLCITGEVSTRGDCGVRQRIKKMANKLIAALGLLIQLAREIILTTLNAKHRRVTSASSCHSASEAPALLAIGGSGEVAA